MGTGSGGRLRICAVSSLGDAQPGAVGGAQRRLVLRARRRLQQQRDQQLGLGPALLLHGDAWSRSRSAISTLSTTGSRRGSRTTVSRRARSGRSKLSLLDGDSGLARTRALPRTGHLVRDLGDGRPTMTDRVAVRVRRIGSARAPSHPERK
jgi:hypothetical protein